MVKSGFSAMSIVIGCACAGCVVGMVSLTGIGVISDLKEIGAVGHRVLHGGEKFTASCLIDDACIAAIEENIPLGPLHNPANLSMGSHRVGHD